MKPIHIKKSHEGLFTAKAKRAGMSTGAYAAKEQNAPGKLGAEARFAKNIGHSVPSSHPMAHTSKHN